MTLNLTCIGHLQWHLVDVTMIHTRANMVYFYTQLNEQATLM